MSERRPEVHPHLRYVFVLTYGETPKSLNAGGTGSRRHWSVGHKEKRQWEGIWGMLLLERRVPRHMVRVYVEVLLEYEDNRRRDAENFRSAISKPLADVLVKMGYIADDTSEFFEMGYVKIRSGVDLDDGMVVDKRHVNGRTTISLHAEYSADNATQVLP